MTRKNVVVEVNTKTISGKSLSSLLGVKPKDYVSLYKRRGEPDYCACIDLGMCGSDERVCHGMDTVMKVLTRSEIKEFPEEIKIISEGPYKSGEVHINKEYNIAYLYVGQDEFRRDVVINLGGRTYNKGNIEIGHINYNGPGRISFDRKVFPK